MYFFCFVDLLKQKRSNSGWSVKFLAKMFKWRQSFADLKPVERRAESQGHGEVSRGDGEHGGDGSERVRLGGSLIFVKSNRNGRDVGILYKRPVGCVIFVK